MWGKFGEICVRQQSEAEIELGELLIAEGNKQKILLQVYDLLHGSQLSTQKREMISGMELEEEHQYELMEPHLRNYVLAFAENVLSLAEGSVKPNKVLPHFMAPVRGVKKEDFAFMSHAASPLFLGNLRSGSKVLDVPVNLNGELALSHHILIPASTGKGKSNLLSVLLWNGMKQDYCSFLILDPHDEYYGRHKLGLKDHPTGKIAYFTSRQVPPGQRSLVINLSLLKPGHFDGSYPWTPAQKEAMGLAYKEFKDEWIQSIMLDKLPTQYVHEGTVGVVKRRLSQMLDISVVNGELVCDGLFKDDGGETVVSDIISLLENRKSVIIDTSCYSSPVEILIGSLLCHELFSKFQYYSRIGTLAQKPVVSIVIEEAPRVLGKDVLEQGPNIFSTISREGRKFKIGLTAVTQLPSLIPKEVLANMNTKIILGMEMKPERQSIIESSSQDLSQDGQTIASLDKGEAIITSTFSKFAIPVKIPLFEDVCKKDLEKYNGKEYKMNIAGIKQVSH